MSDHAEDNLSYRAVYIAGIKDKRYDIEIKDGRFASVAETGRGESVHHPERELWIGPGFIDLHTHLAWTDFDYADQLKRDPQEVEAMQAEAFAATLRTGVTAARDAGGLAPAEVRHLATRYELPLQVFSSGLMLGAAEAADRSYLKRRLTEAFASGAEWVKIMATGGLGAPAETVLDPIFAEDDFALIVRETHARGKKVLVHTWGGVTVDWAVQAGVESIEHGMFLDEDQAYRLAEAGVALVPTTSIYRIAADPKGALALPPLINDRAARAAEAHTRAVGYAKRAGVRIGFGTDYATPALHGRNLQELDTLMDCGLTRAEAWRAATSDAAAILGAESGLGRIAEGFQADAVIYDADPFQAPNADALRRSIAAVIKNGRVIADL